MNRSSFIAACALMVLALTLVAKMIFSEAENPAGAIATKSDPGAKPWTVGNRKQDTTKSLASRPRTLETPASEGFTVRSGRHTESGENGNAGSPDERAAKVESHAHERLEMLDRHLHLNSAQKRNIFPLLAQNSPGYEPSMIIGGNGVRNVGIDSSVGQSSAGSEFYGTPTQQQDISAAILSELYPDQQALYEDLLIDDGLWWAEIISKIDADFQQSNSNGSPPAAPTADDTGAGENLFDLLGR